MPAIVRPAGRICDSDPAGGGLQSACRRRQIRRAVRATGPEPLPYDLRWRMFGIPVRVHWTFWLFTAILGFNIVEFGFVYLLVWMACAFVSILVHELGHALTA